MYNNRHHPFNFQYNHKFGFHVNGWVKNVHQEILRLKPRIVKVLDPNVDALRTIRQAIPDCLIIYRHYFPHQNFGDDERQAREQATSVAGAILAQEAVRVGLVDLVEGYNEVLPESAPERLHQLYDVFQAHFAYLIRSVNPRIEPIAFNFGTGNGTGELIEKCYPQTLQSYKWLGVHEYDWPTMGRLHFTGLNQGNGGMWLALRYRRMFGELLRKFPDRYSVIITECGMTQGAAGGQDIGPWAARNTVPGPLGETPVPITPEAYWDSLRWYNDELMKDNYVAGACLFVTGAVGGWDTFEHLGTITPKIFDFQRVIQEMPKETPDGPVEGLRTQIFFYLGDGKYVGVTGDLPEGTKLEIKAVPQDTFQFWQDHEGNPVSGHTVEVEAGFNKTLTPYFSTTSPQESK